MQPVLVSLVGTGRAEKGGERTLGRTQRLGSTGAYSCLPSLSVYRDRTLLTDSKNHGM